MSALRPGDLVECGGQLAIRGLVVRVRLRLVPLGTHGMASGYYVARLRPRRTDAEAIATIDAAIKLAVTRAVEQERERWQAASQAATDEGVKAVENARRHECEAIATWLEGYGLRGSAQIVRVWR